MGAFNIGDIIVTIKAKTEDLQRGLGEVQAMANKTQDLGSKISSGLQKSTDASKKFALGAIAAGSAIAGLGVAGVTSAASFEQSRIAFETMLGSAQKARSLMNDIAKFAQTTPFELPEVVAGSKQLLAFGFAQEQIIPTMRKLGDIASGVGVPVGQLTNVFGQVRVAGRLMGQDLLQFTNAGVPLIEALATTMHKPQKEIKKLVEEGKVGFPEVEAAINSLTNKGSKFGGMMEKQSHSFSGVVSNIKDGFGQFLRTMVGITNAGDIIEGGLFDKVKRGAEKLMPMVQELPKTLTEGFQKLKPWLSTIIGLIIGGLVPAVTAAAAAFGSWLLALAPFLALGAAFGYLWQKNKMLFYALAGAVVGLATAFLVSMMPAIVAAIAGFASLAIAVIAAVAPFVLAGAAIGAVAYLIVSHWETVKSFFVELWWKIQDITQSFINWLSATWPLILAIITGPLGLMVLAIVRNWDTIFEFFRALPGRIGGFFTAAGSWLWDVGAAIIRGLVGGMRSMGGAVWEGTKAVADKIGQFFGGAGGWLWEVGKAIIMGLVNGMKNAIGWVNDAAGKVADAVKNKLKSVLGIHSPSKVFMEYGVFLNQGLADGLKKSAQIVQDALTIPSMNINGNYAAASATNSGPTSTVVSNTNQTTITGPINIGSKQDSDYFFKKFDRNIQLEEMGLATDE